MMVEETSINEEKVEAEVSPPPISPRPQSSKKPKSLSRFLEIFACVEVNMPLLKNLREMPAHVDSLKELLLKKKSLKK
ncbi:hypothetical protein PIB30_110707, partial [Stylosanthes scabra]|nr:hypothetical protein [Stylosanthes scabra]